MSNPYNSALPMDWMNYNHLFYFWAVARHGSVSKASAELQLSQPTISEQVRKLEQSLGVKLFERAGRGLRLSDAGQMMFSYAEQIFRLGKEMTEAVRGDANSAAMRLVIGVAQSLPTLAAFRLIAPALKCRESLHLSCIEDRVELLFARLALHQIDVVLSDAPLRATVNLRAFNHLLERCGVSFMAAGKLARNKRFPQCLDQAPFLMPESSTTLHRSLQTWFERKRVRPRIVAEFSDSALLEIFGQEGLGIFAVPSIVERDARRRYNVRTLGRTKDITEEFYAITADRRITHPALAAIAKAAGRRD